jgi:hypothetical protein
MENFESRLVEDNWITLEQLMLARQESEKIEKSLWIALVKLGYLSGEDITLFFAQESGISYVKISDYRINQDLLVLLDEDFCIQNCVFPLFKVGNRLFVACSNPLNTALIDSLAKMSGCAIEPLISSTYDILEALDLYWRLEEKIFEAGKFIVSKNPLEGLSLWRQAKRLPLRVPVTIRSEYEPIVRSDAIEGITRDISDNGTSVGAEIPLFLPQGLKVSLDFNLEETDQDSTARIFKAKGAIVHSHMEKGGCYFLGIKLTQIQDAERSQLLKLASG